MAAVRHGQRQQAVAEHAILAARIYQNLGQWSNETNAWNYAAQSAAGRQTRLKPYYCLALSPTPRRRRPRASWHGSGPQLTPKLQRLTLSPFQEAKSSASTAQQTCSRTAKPTAAGRSVKRHRARVTPR